jgi:hypothetical protein
MFLLTTASRRVLGPTKPPIQWAPSALSLGVKLPGREADHSSSSSAEVKNAWSYTSTPQCAFLAWCSVKAQAQRLIALQELLINPVLCVDIEEIGTHFQDNRVCVCLYVIF